MKAFVDSVPADGDVRAAAVRTGVHFEVFRVEVGEGVIEKAFVGVIIANYQHVHQARDEIRGECDDQRL